jgi:CubicO group peptidase (beta-lactamase class C family)
MMAPASASTAILQDALVSAALRVPLAHAAVAVVQDGQIIIACHGVQENDRFYLASLAKSLTAHVAMAVLEEVDFALDRSLASIMPELDWLEGRLSFERLLNMQIGLSEAGASNFGLSPDLPVAERLSRMAFATRHKDGPMAFSYHNGAYVSACTALERLTGENAEDLFPATLKRTSELEHISIIGDDNFIDIVPTVHTDDAFCKVPLIVGRNSLGSGGFGGSIVDMARWVAQSLTKQRDACQPAPNSEYHLGWFHSSTGEVITRYHTGSGPGYGHYCALLDDRQIGVVVLTSGHKSVATAISAEIMHAMGELSAALAESALVTERGIYMDRLDLATFHRATAIELTGQYLNLEAGQMAIATHQGSLRIVFADCPSANGLIVSHPNGGLMILPDHPAVRHDPDQSELLFVRSTGPTLHIDHYGAFSKI